MMARLRAKLIHRSVCPDLNVPEPDFIAICDVLVTDDYVIRAPTVESFYGLLTKWSNECGESWLTLMKSPWQPREGTWIPRKEVYRLFDVEPISSDTASAILKDR